MDEECCCCSKCICLREDYSFDERYFWCEESGEIIEDPDYSPIGYCSGYMER